MAIIVTCECGKQFRAKEEQVGKRARCAQCGRVLMIQRGEPDVGTPGSITPRDPLSTPSPNTPTASSTPDPTRDELKKCPFCSELIKAEAIKCRHCGEMLAVSPPTFPFGLSDRPTSLADGNAREASIYEGNPSMWSIAGSFVLCALLGVLGLGVVFVAPLPGCLILTLAGLCGLGAYVGTRYTRYVITTERIEVERGWLSRQVDNLDLFRVKDLRVSQGIFDRAAGIGTITVVSRDSSDRVLRLSGIARPRELYDRLKVEALRAGRRRGVVQVDQ